MTSILERRSRFCSKPGHHDGFAVGTTSNFLKVAVPSQSELTNQVHPVTITAASERWAIGHLAAQPATTTRLPML